MIVGCDYSTKAVHLAWFKEEIWEHLYVPMLDGQNSILELGAVLDHILNYDDAVYLEMPWMRNNPTTALKLVRICTIVEVISSLNEVDVHWVAVNAWRSKVFGKGKYTRDQAKKLAITKAKELTGMDVDDNTADAICIALYGMEQA